LICLDHRGAGLSDPQGLSEHPSVEERAKEVLAVLDAAGSEQPAILANNTGGLVAIFFAASYPGRVSSLILDGCWARLMEADDYPCGVPKQVLERALARVSAARVEGRATEFAGLRWSAPHALSDAQFVNDMGRVFRYSHSPAMAKAETEMVVYSDLRPVLPAIQAPTLVLYRRDDQLAGKPHARYLSDNIAGAKLVELPGDDNLIIAGDADADLDEIEEFLTGARHAPDTDRVLATVLFTDIVGSTERAGAIGDRRWRDLLDSHDRAVRRQLERFRGREVNTVGDGFVATFDGPGRAIQCACAIRDAVKVVEIEVRTGLHTGEIEMRGEDVAGIAVHLAQRVSALAQPGEVLVSRTVTDLVAGSGIQFEDRGEHELKGVPGTWHLYSVVF
jgi:class 3 adenylate cyclase